MDIEYRTKILQRCATIPGYAVKKLGPEQARKFLLRIATLMAATHFEDLRNVPGHFHELGANRKGRWAFDLNQPYRLIVTPKTHPIPIDANGCYVWKEITNAVIVEIVNYHHEGN